jgi:hypothetical protein
MRVRSVVLPTPVGPRTRITEFGAHSRMAARSRSLASTRRGCATVKSWKCFSQVWSSYWT